MPLEGEKGNKAFAETYKADFPLLSDPTKETATAYGVLNERGRCQSLDVLYRQGRQDRVHRQDGRHPSGDLRRRYGGETGRAEGSAA